MAQPNFKEEINKLVVLQEVDSQLYSLNRQKEEKPAFIEKIESEYKAKLKIVEDFEQKSKAILLKRKEKENDAAVKDESVKKFQLQLYSLKTNKEYTTMLSEISSVKADKFLIEEDILKLYDEQDKLKIDLEKEQEVIKQEKVKYDSEKQKVLNLIKEIDTQVAQLLEKRKVLEKDVDLKILTQYNRIIKNKGNLAVVKVEHNACGGCHMNMPPQVTNEIKMNTRLIFCEMCARILYIND